MCLGVPGLIVERQEGTDELASGIVEFAGVRRRVCLACVPEAQPGDYVIVHAGIALSRVDPVEAQRVFAYLNEMDDTDGWAGDSDEIRG
ncbi:MAG: HypC/HybG/HupF family hydrogenase formation chaperone [Gemmataceae bacterium]